jgi:formylglycine-generating enzyme required for sulfatase activity
MRQVLARSPLLQIVLAGLSSGLIFGTTEVLAQTNRTDAKAVTVLITEPGQTDGDGGTGVLVARTGNRYRMLTNCHVLRLRGEYTLRINDGDPYRVNITTPNCHPRGIDLAIVEFTANQTYPTAPIRSETNLDQLLNDSRIILAGFSNSFPEQSTGFIQRRTFQFLEGTWRSIREADKGYDLLHTAAALDGMSGGPVFDSAGRLVAIHGEMVTITSNITGFSAIPIHYYTSWQGLSSSVLPSPSVSTPTPPITRPTPTPTPTPQPRSTPTPVPTVAPTPRVTPSQNTFLGLPVEPFSYTTATVSATGEVRTFSRQAEVGRYVERGITLPRGAVELEMVAIQGGAFIMGQTEAEKQQLIKDAGQELYDQFFSDEQPRHQVTVPDFYMGRYEVTQAQYEAVMGTNPTEGRAWVWNPKTGQVTPDTQIPAQFLGSNKPVVGVSWDDAQEFIRRLNQQTGKTYRLPTEAEWEYAARAGTTTPFSYGETITAEVANYGATVPYGNAPKGEYRQVTIGVTELPANPWGLQHIHGNVWEWCADEWYDNYSQKPGNLRSDGSIAWTKANTNISPSIDGARGLRGGSWSCNARGTRSANRGRNGSDFRDNSFGFRVVLVR